MDREQVEAHLLQLDSKTYNAYYNGKMSYALAGKEWEDYMAKCFPEISKSFTSENVFKTVIDMYAENLIPKPEELDGFSNVLMPLLSRGEALAVVDKAKDVHFPERFEMLSDGRYTIAAAFTRNLEKMEDSVTFLWSDGTSRLYSKDVPQDLAPADAQGYQFVEQETGNQLFRLALDDKGFGGMLASLQDRINHSILDQTVIAEMYARPFWYLLNVQEAPNNPYLPKASQPDTGNMREQRTQSAAGRIFTSSSDGPFGQLQPPTINDMVSYHDSLVDKVSQNTGIPPFYFKPGSGTPPTGVALMVLSKRFNNKVSRIREDIEPVVKDILRAIGVTGVDGDKFELWNTDDDLLQEAKDAHGVALATMGMPLKYIAEQIDPGMDLDDYLDDGMLDPLPTPDQVAEYANNPGQPAGQPAINPIPTPPAVPAVPRRGA